MAEHNGTNNGQDIQDLRDRVLKMEVQMLMVAEGVANFRKFQNDARTFFDRHEEREIAREKAEKEKQLQEEKKDKKRAAVHYWWLGLLSALIVAGFSIILTEFFQLKAEHHISDAITIGDTSNLKQNASSIETYSK